MTRTASSFRAVVRGRVQGVGFRYYARSEALALGVSGYVRNLADGSVEVVAVGPTRSLRALIEGLERGPGTGRVDECLIEWDATSEPYTAFTIEF